MIFTRTLTPGDLKSLGGDPDQRLNAILDVVLGRLSNTLDKTSVESRILAIMSPTVSINAREIMDTHNAVYGSALALSYIRFVIHGMYQSQLIKRVKRGRYVKT